MSQRILLVEGKDDFHVICALLLAHQIPEVFEFDEPNREIGVDALIDSLGTRVKAIEAGGRLGIVVDADTDPPARWESIRSRLEGARCTNVPNVPDPAGTILDAPRGCRVGIWMMPDNRLQGMLESFVTWLVPAGDVLLPMVDAFLASIPDPSRRFPPVKLPKARIHAFLALQKEPGKPMGQAITANYLDASRPTVEPFLQWIRNLLVA
jgi:hypothetical protein